MEARGSALWPVLAIIFFITTIVFGFLALENWNAPPPAPVPSAAAPDSEVAAPEAPETPPPPAPVASSWETESIPGPMANIPFFVLDREENRTVLLKTTVKWFVLEYEIPEDLDLQQVALEIRGPGDRVYWGTGPIPRLAAGSQHIIAIPGDYLPGGDYYLILEDKEGQRVHYPFRIRRRRLPG
jgi:hypothetical protein